MTRDFFEGGIPAGPMSAELRAQFNTDLARIREMTARSYRSTYETTRRFLDAGMPVEDVMREQMDIIKELDGSEMSDLGERTREVITALFRSAVEDAVAGRPPRETFDFPPDV